MTHEIDSALIDGRFVRAGGTETFVITDSNTGETMSQCHAVSVEQVDEAVKAAHKAFGPWSNTPVETRSAHLRAIAEGMRARRDEIAEAVAKEVGMPLKLAGRIQVDQSITVLDDAAQEAESRAFTSQLANSLILQQPVGVVGAITPWNYPLYQTLLKVAPAMAVGATVVLKPSEVAPMSTQILAEVIEASDLPAGVVNIFYGAGPTIGEALAGHPLVDMVSLTGSARAGRRVMELAAGRFAKVALELGGKSASVVLDDADLDLAVAATVGSCLLNSGQTCSALTRLIVPAKWSDEVAEKVIAAMAKTTLGPSTDSTSRMGPLVSATQQSRVRGFIQGAIDDGAELLCGGLDLPEGLPAGGHYVAATAFHKVRPESTLAQEEVFGPVLTILTYESVEEAISLANGTQYGLAGAVFGADEERALSVAKRVRAGQVDINGARFNPAAPFGGMKQSGLGRERGPLGLDEFLEIQSIQR